MKKLIKWTIWIVASIILIVILASVLLSFLVKPNDIKPLISKQIYKATGQHVVFKGDIHWRLFPTLSIKIDDAIVNNPPGFGKKPLATISQLDIGVRILPLLHREIQTTDLVLNGVTINLVKNKNGKTNWQTKNNSAPDPQPVTTTQNSTRTKTKAPITLKIPVVQIKNATLNWQNNMNGQKTTIKNLNVTAQNIQQKKSFPIKISFYIDNNKPDMHGTISLQSNVALKPNNNYVLKQLHLQTNLKGKGLPEGKLKTDLQGDATITSNSATLNPLNLKLNNSSITGGIAIKDFATLATQFNLKASPFSLNKLSGVATISGNITAAKPNSAPGVKNLNGTISIDVKNGAYQGINLDYWINAAKALRKQQMPPKMQGPNRTVFGDLKASVSIRNGVATTRNLSVSSPVLYANGGGQINLVSQTIGFKLKVGSANSNDALLQNIPLIVSGSLKSPSVSLDKDALLKGFLKQQLQKQLDNAVQNLKLKLF